MNRIPTALLLIGLLIGLIGLIGGVWIGGRIEQLGTETESLRLGQATLTVDAFRRGWLHSTATTRLTTPALPPLDLRQQLTHNPLNGNLLHLDSRPDPDNVWCARWLSDCGTTRLISRLSWRGMQRHTLTLPALTLPDLDLSGLHAELRLGPWAWTDGELALSVERLTLSEPVFALEDAALRAELASRARYQNFDLETEVEAVRLPTIPAGRINLAAGAERIDRDALADLAASTDPASALLAGQRLLRQQPRLNVSRLHWQTKHGELHLHGELTLRAINLLRLLGGAGPLALIETGEGELRIDRPLAERLLAQWSMNQTGPTDQTATERLARWQAAGFVRLDNNVYHLHFRIDHQGLLLNGIAVASSS